MTKREQESDFTQQLAQMTRNAKINLQVRNKYMEYERLKAYARLDGFTEGRAQGRAEGQAEANLKNAIIAVKEFNQTPEIVAPLFGIDLTELHEALSTEKQ
ncbi:MAG: hypothetical protein UHJ46_00840 [Treponema sp.]|nr:hypothetical protein [Treponema sp.]